MRKMASWKGIGPLNRPPLSVRLVSFRKRINPQSSPDLGVKTSSSLQRCYLRSSSYAQTNTFRSGFRMDQQREARQAIFLSRRGLKSDERLSVSSVSPASQTVHLSSPASSNSCRYPSRPESFLFRAAIREDVKRGSTPPPAFSSSESTTVRTEQKSKVRQEEREGTEQLRKPKLSMAKCRRNVENFLEACRKIGVPQDKVCLPSDILQLNLCSIKGTLECLLSFGECSQTPAISLHLLGFVVFYCTLMLLLFLLYRWVLNFWTQA
ncbi:UAP56-interacting factor-like isoform X2 [Xenopus laevis]|uniref:UAP56-interacting factor n=1 Tax=Xenopus laevis TaxID=8355 RepID=A0A8J1KSG6_XENLA|nr:UAP56-interacting factor-like isoform X2 [Xenopus laevis]